MHVINQNHGLLTFWFILFSCVCRHSVSELVTMSDIRGESDGFDHIVVELSGIADPKGVRAQFQEALFYDMPIMERVRLDTMITVVDCSAFLKYLQSSQVRLSQVLNMYRLIPF